MIEPAKPWDEEIKLQLEQADVLVFLVSADLIASDYVMNIELPAALQRRAAGNAEIVPVLVRDVRLPEVFRSIQCVKSHDDRPVALCPNAERDSAWCHVTEQIAVRVKIVNARRAAEQAGRRTLNSTQLKAVLTDRLVDAVGVRLCSRTGLGWYKDLGAVISKLVDAKQPDRKGRFLFLDPEGIIFRIDSSMIAWTPAPGPDFALTFEERKRRANELYDNLTAAGHQVRVTDLLLEAV